MRKARMIRRSNRGSIEKASRGALKNGVLLAAAYGATRLAASWLRRYDFRNRLVVITGGSRGLGLLLARHLADEGAGLVICARDDEELAWALLNAVEDRHFLSQLARNGAEVVRERFDLRAQARRLEDTYLKAML